MLGVFSRPRVGCFATRLLECSCWSHVFLIYPFSVTSCHDDRLHLLLKRLSVIFSSSLFSLSMCYQPLRPCEWIVSPSNWHCTSRDHRSDVCRAKREEARRRWQSESISAIQLIGSDSPAQLCCVCLLCRCSASFTGRCNTMTSV